MNQACSNGPALRRWRRAKRALLLQQRLATGDEQRKRWNASIEDALRALLYAMDVSSIAFYWPFKGEFDGRSLMRELHQRGVRLALPAVVQPQAPLEFRLWHPGVEMAPGVYDIPVPQVRDVIVPAAIIAPLLGFDVNGYRLGHGGGYYDRTLAAICPEPLVIGIGYEISKLDTIYPQPHDLAMHLVVTEANVYDFR